MAPGQGSENQGTSLPAAGPERGKEESRSDKGEDAAVGSDRYSKVQRGGHGTLPDLGQVLRGREAGSLVETGQRRTESELPRLVCDGEGGISDRVALYLTRGKSAVLKRHRAMYIAG